MQGSTDLVAVPLFKLFFKPSLLKGLVGLSFSLKCCESVLLNSTQASGIRSQFLVSSFLEILFLAMCSGCWNIPPLLLSCPLVFLIY